MNVFKLLSRSSKAQQSAPAHNIPSSGAVANPQLFGHPESTSISTSTSTSTSTTTSLKRKRGQNGAGEQTDISVPLPTELDFFAGTSKEKKTKKRPKAKPASGDDGEDSLEEEEPYDIDECKKILRSHKLKVAVLEDFFVSQNEVSRKEKKKRKKAKEDKKKDVKIQLYPKPLTEFAQLRTRYNISRRLAQNIHEQGYRLPTEVQLVALPLLLGEAQGGCAGDIDLLTVAPTGSGKTIAFLIPIINALLKEDKNGREGLRGVVLAPTRELAAQIVNEVRKLAKGTGIRGTLVRKGMKVVEHGGMAAPLKASDEEEDASESDEEDKTMQTPGQAELVKASILVATPLALLNALKRPDNTVASLPSVLHMVLDEADVLLDPLFREQTLAIWNACSNPLLRVGLWSATMGSNIDSLTVSTMNTRWENISSSSRTTLPQRSPLLRIVVGLKDTAIPNISHQLTYAATEQGKLLGLRQLLHPTSLPSNASNQPSLRPPFLVFTQTIPRAIALHSELLYDIPPEAGGSSRIAALHANLSSSARDTIMTKFRRGEIWVLITTDLLARGVDFRGLNGVVNYDAPNSAAAYVHRVGRTGRAGREGGVAVTLYTSDDIPHIKLIANVIRASEKLRGVREGEGSVKQWLLDALPDVGKRERQQLKKRGVESRRKNGEEGKKNRISTKSGYERRVGNNRKGAREASKRREGAVIAADDGESEGGFEGLEE
ncbi:P-loop containing nucleoside triphosphate hydrolase protein [Phaeosphaeriaceae sp. PMI808]|nr:P-loop containing nucleoside triphosphate hydrolase protein [Phaeosphaeriaceae sp. PMI808]